MSEERPFGQQVRGLRRAQDLTQEELARQVGCAAITVRKIEAGDMRPSQQVAARLAAVLGVPEEERSAFVRAARALRQESRERIVLAASPVERLSTPVGELASRNYQLAEQIGAGSFGVVYRALQLRLDRAVAIKVISPQYADHPDFIRRFEAEARLVARLEHPHIVPLYDYWREPGVAYLVMRYVRGGSLLSLLEQGPPPLPITLRIAEELSSALRAAHRAGVIHRDVKPANVLLDEHGHAYLADFGIAKDLSNPDPALTFTGSFVGSPAYSSPEQIRAETVTPQTDVYALGVLLYELLTGRRPFSGPSQIDYIQQHLYAPMPALAEARAGLPTALDAVIQQATAKSPTARYSSIDALLDELRRAFEMSAAPALVSSGPRAASPTVVLDLMTSDNPYKGLHPFDEADAATFFGRESLVQRLIERLAERGELTRFLAVVGPSGSGKSSLVRAGLLPALRRDGLPGSARWYIVAILPGADPFAELANALWRLAPAGVDAEGMQGLLRASPQGLMDAVQRVLPDDRDVELLLFIDQFEELFTLCSDEGARRHFLEGLILATLAEGSRLRILITIRADFVDRPLQYVDFGDLFSQRSELVLPLTTDDTERAIVGPARWAGLVLEEGLSAAIVAAIGAEPGGLPLLQHALSELYDLRQGRVLTHAAYTAIGGVTGALTRCAEALFNSLALPDQETARRVLLALVSPGSASEDTRRRVSQVDLRAAGPPAVVDHILASFGRARLLTFDRDPRTREPTVEVAHEALLRSWPRLRGWLNKSRERLQIHRRLATAAAEWSATERDDAFLASGGPLVQFETLLGDAEIWLSELEQAYLDASLRARERQTQATLGLATLAYQQQQAAQERALIAQGQVLAAAARAAIAEGDLDQARALALVAVQVPRPAAEAQAILSQAAYAPGTRRLYSGQSGAVMDVAFVDNDRFVLSGSSDNTLCLWDAQTGVERMRLHGLSANLWCITADPSGQLAAASAPTGLIHVWNIRSGEEIYRLAGHAADTTGIAFSPDGRTLLSASKDMTLRRWDLASGATIRTYHGHSDWVWGVAFSPDGQTFVSGSSDNTLRLWDVASGETLRTFSGHVNRVHSVAFSPDGRFVVSGSWDETLRLWDVVSAETIRTFASNNGTVPKVAFSPDGTQIVSASANIVHVWDVTRGELVQRFREHRDEVYTVEFSRDGGSILSGSRDGTVRLWDCVNGAELGRILGHTSWIRSVALSNDGRFAVSGSWDRTARVWDVASGRSLLKIDSHSDSVEGVALSIDGALLLTGSADASVRLWEAASGQELRRFLGHEGYVWDVAFSPDSSMALSCSHDGSIRLWDVASGAELRRFSGHTAGVESIAFSPNGSAVLSGSADGSVRLWNVANGSELLRLTGHSGAVNSVALSPDGKLALSGSADGTARLWDLSSGVDLQRFPKQSGPMLFVAFSPDGKMALFGAGITALALWDVASGQELRRFDATGALVYSAAFSADGRTILAGTTDGTLRRWRVDTLPELLAWTAQNRFVPELSESQRAAYQLL
jgi:WD40 repeat protein/serine/threonine protein kinase/DNA-binding XRE family transcriptional regulator